MLYSKSCYYEKPDNTEPSETKLRECKALRAGVGSCPPTLNGDEGAETVRLRILYMQDSEIQSSFYFMYVYK